MELYKMCASEAVEAVKEKKIKARELTEAVLARLSDTDDQIKAFVTVTAETALAQADAVDQNISARDNSPLAGVPIALKDNLCLEGVPAAAGSRSLASFPAPYSAAVVERSVKAGGVIIGKTNMDEFGMGSTAETPSFPASRNPLDLKRSAGDGSAAAVASGQAILGFASDSGGSARISASYCGVAAFRPTSGSISRYGLISAVSSMSQTAFVAKKAVDFNLILDSLYGFDPRDSATVIAGERALEKSEGPVKRVGLPGHIFAENNELPGAFLDKIRHHLSSAGPEIVEVSLSHFTPALWAYYIIVIAESFSNLSRYEGIRYGFTTEDDNLEELYRRTRDQGLGEEAKRRSILGAYLLNKDNFEKYYEQALRVWSLVKEDFSAALHTCDLIVLPVARSQAPLLSEGRSFIENYQGDEFCAPVSLAGLPSVSIPAFEIEGMPLGIQLVGPSFSDRSLIEFASLLGQEINYSPLPVI